ncbi:PilZ domain-containing protein [Noviherbaspirillum sp. Root189]|uniref:PilZ domain-containing protein n=1 Tax=Noviherbaspirillum sp. Root189 TaxID=1736487 RepID=UPI0012E3C9CE|nr:PilZ domain-containing protein [Noviherbaspirillum sp. Root189]
MAIALVPEPRFKSMRDELERRLITRTPLRLPARLLVSSDHPFDVETIDVSVGGACVLVNQALPLGTGCAIAFEVQMPEGTRRINAWGAVVYDYADSENVQHRIGIAFVDMDAYSRHLLQRLGQQ